MRAATLLSPHLEPDNAAGSPRSTLARLRAATPAVLGTGITQLRLAAGVNVDTRQLEALAIELTGGDGGMYEEVDLGDLTAELLLGWNGEWVVLERERVQELCLRAIESVAERFAAEGRFARAITAVYQARRIDPLHESAMRVLMQIHLAEGNQVQAVSRYLDFRLRLRAVLGVEPSESVRALMAPLVAASE